MTTTDNLAMHSRITTPQHLHYEQLAAADDYPLQDKRSIHFLIKRLFAVHMINRTQKDILSFCFRAAFESNGWLCWAWNNTIAEEVGLSHGNKVSDHLKILRDLGLITFIDSPNCRRRENFGVCTKILHARFDELNAFSHEARAEKKKNDVCQTLYRTYYKRIKRMLDDVNYSSQFDFIRACWEEAKEIVETGTDILGSYYKDAVALLDKMFGAISERLVISKRGSRDADFGIPIHNTNSKSESVNCNGKRSSAHAEQTKSQNAANRGKKAFEKKPSESGQTVNDQSLDLGSVLAACPAIHEFYPDYFRKWDDLVRIRHSLALTLGISESAIRDADNELFPRKTTIALAIILQKYNQGDVTSPGGYLRGMVARARAGKLHLVKSIRGMQSASLRPDQQLL